MARRMTCYFPTVTPPKHSSAGAVKLVQTVARADSAKTPADVLAAYPTPEQAAPLAMCTPYVMQTQEPVVDVVEMNAKKVLASKDRDAPFVCRRASSTKRVAKNVTAPSARPMVVSQQETNRTAMKMEAVKHARSIGIAVGSMATVSPTVFRVDANHVGQPTTVAVTAARRLRCVSKMQTPAVWAALDAPTTHSVDVVLTLRQVWLSSVSKRVGAVVAARLALRATAAIRPATSLSAMPVSAEAVKTITSAQPTLALMMVGG